MLLDLKRSVNLKESGAKVHRIRKTQSVSILIELEAIKDRQKLRDAVKLVTGPDSNVCDLIPMLKSKFETWMGSRRNRRYRRPSPR